MKKEKQTVFVTGAAGFIGFFLSERLLNEGNTVVGLDNMNDYYDVTLKKERLKRLQESPQFHFVQGDLADQETVEQVFSEYRPDAVVNLAAQAGVRYSITHPDAYISSNLVGFFHILEACRRFPVRHLVYASSSSVYGANQTIPYSTADKTDSPVSLYAATKKSNELMAYAYSKLYKIPATGLRFFTVYGPMGRPDMAYFSFADRLVRGETIQIFNYGNCKRDFTYIDDVVTGVTAVLGCPPEQDADGIRHKVYNIGNHQPVHLLEFVGILQEELVRVGVLPEDYDFEAHKELVPMQPGDVEVTYADVSELRRDFGFQPSTPLRIGLRRFAEWYREYYGENSRSKTEE